MGMQLNMRNADEPTRIALMRRMWLTSLSLGLLLSAAVIFCATVLAEVVPTSAVILGALLIGSVLSWANVDRFDRPALAEHPA